MTGYRKTPEPYSLYTSDASRIIQRYLAGAVGVPDWSRVLLSWQREDGSWTISDEQAASVHAAGSAIMWVGLAGVSRISSSAGSQEVGGGGSAPVAPKTISVPASAAPVATDAAGTADDRITLTRVPNVRWRVGPAGSYTYYDEAWFGGVQQKQAPWTGGSSVEVAAVPVSGYVLTGTAAWNVTFTNEAGNTTVTIAAGQAPTANDSPATSTDTVTLTSVAGVIWVVDGVNHPSSEFTGSKSVPYMKGTNTTVTAVAATGYTLSGTTSWNLTFTDAAASEWVEIAAFTAETLGSDREAVSGTEVTIPGGSISPGENGFSIVAGKVVLQTGKDRLPTFQVDSEIGTRWALEFTVHGRPEEYKRNSAYVTRSDPWVSDPFGISFDGTTAHVIQDAQLPYSAEDLTKALPPNVPISTGQTTIRFEADTNTKTVDILVNGAPHGTYTMTAIPTHPQLATRMNVYSSKPTTYSDVRFFSWAGA